MYIFNFDMYLFYILIEYFKIIKDNYVNIIFFEYYNIIFF